MPLALRDSGDTFRFLAAMDETHLSVNGAQVATLNRGQFYEQFVNGAAQVSSDQPLLVARYSTGPAHEGVAPDRLMLLATPGEEYLTNHIVTTPVSGVYTNYINVVAPDAALGAITLDGSVIPSNRFSSIASSGFSGAQIYALSKAQLAAGAANLTMVRFDTSGTVNAPSDAGATQPARLRLGRLVGEELALVDPAVTEVVDRFCAGLERGGARIDEVELPLRTARAAVATMVLPELAAAHATLLAETGEEGYGERTLNAIRRGQQALAVEYVAAVRYRGRFAALVEDLLGTRDALLLPTIPVVAPSRDTPVLELGDGRRMGIQEALTALPGAFNCSGSPVVSVPVGSLDGLPVGLSLVGRIGGDQELLGVAAAVEDAARFSARPALFAG